MDHAIEVGDALELLYNFDTVTEEARPDEPSEETTIESCDDLLALEGLGLLGQITPGQVRCLEIRINAERLQTTKDKLSRLLLVNAEASSNMEEWARLAARHLQDIDRSDPDLCFKYAIFLHRTSKERGEDTILWADYALENKGIWGSEVYAKKVNGLLRLRAEAAHRLWLAAESDYRSESNQENEEMASEYRGLAKDYSREWMDYARASGQKTDAAYKLCVAAAGTHDFCRSAGDP